MKYFFSILLLLVVSLTNVNAQVVNSQDSLVKKENKTTSYYKHSLGASLLMVTNFFPESADYVLLTYGYHVTQKDRVFAEFNTWKYGEPIGTYGSSKEFYPGFVRAYGIGVGYQRFHWKGAFTTAQATSFLKTYIGENNEFIQTGYQLYLQLAVGYRFEFFKKRLYVEPAWALKYWPVDTKFPEAFKKVEEGAPRHIFEPSLNFGVRF